MRKFFYLCVVLSLFSCSKQLTEESNIYRAPTTVIETDEVSEYDETTSTYWYVQYTSTSIRGYDILVLNTSYPDIGEMLRLIIEINGIKGDEYTQINFFKKVPYETYEEFQSNPDGKN
tara:strand:- start:912 stop:1265 length:354 start_codon:yes stop_codon:yes gene_type:complete